MKIKYKLNFLQRSRRLLWYLIVTVLVVSAISITVARSLISNVGSLRDQLEDIVSKYLEQPFRIETFDAKIIGFTPTFIFKNVSLLETDSEKVMVRFKEAQIGMSIFNSIKYGKLTPKSFVISGINLVVTQNKNNTFKVKGIDVAGFDPTKDVDSGNSSELSNWLFEQDKLKLVNSTIHWYNANTNNVLKFSNINILLNNSGNRHTLSGDWQLQSKIAKRFKIELDMNGDILNPASWEGTAYIKGEDANITEVGIPSNLFPLKPISGIYNFEIWADFKLGQLKEIAGATNVRKLKFNASKYNKEIEIDKMAAVWRWDNLADGWALNIDRFYYEVNNKVWPLSRVLVESHHRFQPDSILDIYVDKLNIEDASQFIQKLNVISDEHIAKLQNIDPHGEIFDTHVRFKVNDIFSDDFIFQSEFFNMSANAEGYIPGIEKLSGRISTSNVKGSMILESNDSTINFPRLFRNKLDVTKLDGRLNWNYSDKEWYLESQNLILKNNDIETISNLNIIFPVDSKSPLMDLQVRFGNGKITGTGKYLPVYIMDKDLVKWIDHSLKSGFVETGGVVLQGRLADFPYLKNNGKFEVSFDTKDLVLNYLDKWPIIQNATSKISFSGAGFEINISRAKMLKSLVKDTEIFIRDYTSPELVIKGDIEGTTNDIFEFLINSPIASDNRSVIKEFTISGDSKIDIEINVPLNENKPPNYKGSIDVKDSTISLYNNLFEFNKINGKLLFSDKGFNSDNLNAIFFNKPLNIKIYSQSKDNAFSHHVLVQGKFDSASMQKKFNLPWMENSTGVSNWQGIFNFGYSTQNAEMPASLVITTDFQGINLDLPAPLNKDQESKLPVSIESKFISKDKNRLNITVDNKISLSAIINHEGDKIKLNSANINFNKPKEKKLQDNIILVNGDIRNTNIDLWFDYIKSFGSNKNSKNNNFISPDMNVFFDIDSYYIADKKEETEKQKTEKLNLSGVDPRTIPEFSGEIRNIVYDKSKVGTLSFNFKHSENGFDIKKLNLDSENFNLSSTGIWHIFPNKTRNRFLTKFTNVKFISSDLGATLSSLGFQSVLNKGTSNTDLTVWWHDSPFEFSIDKLSAEILVNVSNGELLDIDPKGGRLLGLLSLSNLPKRLLGDFTDIFSAGLTFDSAIGKVRIAKGQMTTDDIKMVSSLAEIHIIGTTDLVKKEFDQKITVIPNLTDTTAVGVGLLAGLQAFIITKIVASLVGLDEATLKTYHVTGTWENPVITTIEEPKSVIADSIESTFNVNDDSDEE